MVAEGSRQSQSCHEDKGRQGDKTNIPAWHGANNARRHTPRGKTQHGSQLQAAETTRERRVRKKEGKKAGKKEKRKCAWRGESRHHTECSGFCNRLLAYVLQIAPLSVFKCSAGSTQRAYAA